ncbi:hypothetical protein [Pseudoalteromonas sp.]
MNNSFKVPHSLILLLGMMVAASIVLVLAVMLGYGLDVQPSAAGG